MTRNDMSDAAVVAEMLEQIPRDKASLSLTGDGAYDTQLVYEASLLRGAIPIMPPSKNARIRKGDAFAFRNAAIAACRRLGWGIWGVWSGYHRRSRVEAKMHCIKRLGEGACPEPLNAKSTSLNRFTKLGRPQTVAVA